MVWIYGAVLLFIIVLGIIYSAKDLKFIRVFGFEIIRFSFCFLVALVIIGEIIIPIPDYNVKGKEINLNEVLEEETLGAGIQFDDGSFKVLESYGMNFNHLFLSSYEIDGEEEVRFYHYEKNLFGNMKLKYPLSDINIITDTSNRDDYYRAYIGDGIFSGYLLTVGLGDESSEPENYGLGKYRITRTPQEGYFMWVQMTTQPWKIDIGELGLFSVAILISAIFSKKREKVAFCEKWRKRDGVFTWEKNQNSKLW